MSIKIYTDGACRNSGNTKGSHVNPNDPAAWGYIALNEKEEVISQDTKAYRGKTNNQMELYGFIKAMRYILQNYNEEEFYNIEIVTDSMYIVNAINNGWLKNWIRKNDTKRLNFDLWLPFNKYWVQLENKVKLSWTKGHALSIGNNMVDELINQSMDELIKNN